MRRYIDFNSIGELIDSQGNVHYEDLQNLPTADVRENITGKWLRYGEDGEPNEVDTVFWQCSECLEKYIGRTTRIPNFCPNCGAKMIKNSIKEGE